MVRVLFRRQGARDVAYYLEYKTDGEDDEPPGAVADSLVEVGDEEQGEPGSCEDGESE